MSEEVPLLIECMNQRLPAVMHNAVASANVGVVLVVGGPQYRVGSHRQFVLMARRIAAAGIPVLRFDYRGMGDAEGEIRSFASVNDDIRAAVDCMINQDPNIKGVILLGLCDGASASLIYASNDKRVLGLILINPWVRTLQGEARTYLRHYYLQRVLQKSFWRKLFSGNWKMARSLAGFRESIRNAATTSEDPEKNDIQNEQSFLVPMLEGLIRFQGDLFILISGRDLTAQEFIDLSQSDRRWRKALERSNGTLQSFPLADHTMSTRSELNDATDACVSWLLNEKRNW